ncbi:MAG: type II toxin-antitoxin system antitoxin SocA domain-containing protein [Planctomycetota bacterium]
MDISLIVAYLLKEAKDRNTPLTKVALIKILYLLEVEYFRYMRHRLTNLEWQFYHYGPYPPKIELILDKNFDLDRQSSKDGKEFILLFPNQVLEKSLNYNAIPLEINGIANEIIDNWAGMPLKDLLNYVYFETEPMQGVKRKDILDFNKIRPIENIRIEISEEKRKQLQQIQNRLIDVATQNKTYHCEPIHDTLYLKNIALWDEEFTMPNLLGEVTIDNNTIKNNARK